MLVPSDVELAQALRAVQMADPFVQEDDLVGLLQAHNAHWSLTKEHVSEFLKRYRIHLVNRLGKSRAASSTKAAGANVPETSTAKSAQAAKPSAQAAKPSAQAANVPTATPKAKSQGTVKQDDESKDEREKEVLDTLGLPVAQSIEPKRDMPPWLSESPLLTVIRQLHTSEPSISVSDATKLLRAIPHSGWEHLNENLVRKHLESLSPKAVSPALVPVQSPASKKAVPSAPLAPPALPMAAPFTTNAQPPPNVVLSIPLSFDLGAAGAAVGDPLLLPTAPALQPTRVPAIAESLAQQPIFSPFVTTEAAKELVIAGAAVVGKVRAIKGDLKSSIGKADFEFDVAKSKAFVAPLNIDDVLSTVAHKLNRSTPMSYKQRNRSIPDDIVVAAVGKDGSASVVLIVQRSAPQLIIGNLLSPRPEDRDEHYLFVTKKNSMPCVRIPRSESLQYSHSKKFTVDLSQLDWPENEYYPSGHIVVEAQSPVTPKGEAKSTPSTPVNSKFLYIPPPAVAPVTPSSPHVASAPSPALVSPSIQPQLQMPRSQNSPISTPPKKTPLKPVYPAHITAAEVDKGLQSGNLLKGQVRVNARNNAQAFFHVDGVLEDIYIDGLVDRNRAVDGDTVILKVTETAKERAEEYEHRQAMMERAQARRSAKKAAKETIEGANGDAGAATAPATCIPSPDDEEEWEDVASDEEEDAKVPVTAVKPEDVEKEEAAAVPIEEAKVESTDTLLSNGDQKKPFQAKGVVVAIVKRRSQILLAGQLLPENTDTKDRSPQKSSISASKKPPAQFRFFKPKNSRFPKVIIHSSEVNLLWHRANLNHGEQQPWELLENRLLLVELKTDQWTESSMFPPGVITRELGPVGNVEAETVGILMEHEVNFDEFSSEVLACLPQDNAPWVITDDELAKRRDVRGLRVFSIDPPTARDLDDALHIERTADGKWEVGVHIADVSNFIKEGSALDLEARARATSVYMVQQVVPMLPRLLCEQLCSLNAAVDRYAFSAIFILNDVGEVEGRWFGRTVMRSCARLTYNDAQYIIEGKPVDEWNVTTHNGVDKTAVAQDIANLDRLAKLMRARRYDKGVLTLSKAKLSFQLDKDGQPASCSTYILKDSNKLVEEYMLLANMAVAERIYQSNPDKALLRRHPFPDEKGIKNLVSKAKLAGIALDSSSSKALQTSLMSVQDPDQRSVLMMLAAIPMRPATYFCTNDFEEENYWHYALAVPYYTHFTSPIRRYADVIVHRQLLAAIEAEKVVESAYTSPLEPKDIADISDTCNYKKLMSKKAQESSSDLFLCLYLSKLGGVDEIATIVDIRDRDVRLLVVNYALEVLMPLDDIAKNAKTSTVSKPTLTIYWGEKSASNSSGASSRKDATQALGVFDKLKVRLTSNLTTSPCKIVVTVLPPQ